MPEEPSTESRSQQSRGCLTDKATFPTSVVASNVPLKAEVMGLLWIPHFGVIRNSGPGESGEGEGLRICV